MRLTSSRSSISRTSAASGGRSPDARALAASGVDRVGLAGAPGRLRIGASGLRSSWASVARNSSLRRSASRSRASLSCSWRLAVRERAGAFVDARLELGEQPVALLLEGVETGQGPPHHGGDHHGEGDHDQAGGQPGSRYAVSSPRAWPSSQRQRRRRPAACPAPARRGGGRRAAAPSRAPTTPGSPTPLTASSATVDTAMPGKPGTSARREASNEIASTASQLWPTRCRRRTARCSRPRAAARQRRQRRRPPAATPVTVTGDIRPATRLSAGKRMPSQLSTPQRRPVAYSTIVTGGRTAANAASNGEPTRARLMPEANAAMPDQCR